MTVRRLKNRIMTLLLCTGATRQTALRLGSTAKRYCTSAEAIWFTVPDSPAAQLDGGSLTAAVVCGWAGSRKEHVNKYTRLCNQMGLPAWGCILGPLSTMTTLDIKAQTLFVSRLLDSITAQTSARPVRLLVMAYSNNGAVVYQNIVSILSRQPDRFGHIQVAGAVLDSGPGPLTMYLNIVNLLGFWWPQYLDKWLIRHCRDLMKFDVNHLPWVHFFLRALDGQPHQLTALAAEVQQVRTQLSSNVALYKARAEWCTASLLAEKNTWPLLFFYSDKDKLIPSFFIRLLAQRCSQTRPVQEHNFRNSSHVQHFRDHPEEYVRQLHKFIASLT